MDELFRKVIPLELSKLFGNPGTTRDKDIIYFSGKMDVSIREIKHSSTFKQFEENEKLLKLGYDSVIRGFDTEGKVIYSKEYLSIRDSTQRAINNLINSFPILLASEDFVPNKEVNFDFHPRVGTGFEFLKRGRKIIKYLSILESNEEEFDSDFFYSLNDEKLLLRSSNDDLMDYGRAKELERRINFFYKLTNIGRVHINPIYNKISIDGSYSEITLTFVYPNGSLADDQSDAIMKSRAAIRKINLQASKGSKLNPEGIEDLIQQEDDHTKGYFVSAISRGKNVLKSVIQKRTKDL